MVHRPHFRSIMFILAIVIAACSSPRSKSSTIKGETLGTTFTIHCVDPQRRDLGDAVDSLLNVVNRSLSLLDPSSSVSIFNAAQESGTASNDPHLIEVMRLSQAVWLQTNGAFDPTMLPLVDAWGLGRAGREAMDTMHLDSLRSLIGLHSVRIEGSGEGARLKKQRRAAGIDPNGIAQGYTVDLLASLLEQRGISNFMIELGGEIRARGARDDGTPWTTGIDRPVEGSEHELLTTIDLRDRSLATSGNYRDFIEIGGKRYGHVIDPRSGRPVSNGLLSVSVLHERCAIADALATALLVLGPKEARSWLQRETFVQALLVVDDHAGGYRTWATPGWPGEADAKGWGRNSAQDNSDEELKRSKEKQAVRAVEKKGPSEMRPLGMDSAAMEEKRKAKVRELQGIEEIKKEKKEGGKRSRDR